MKLRDQDFFHGAALTQIVEHSSFKALNKADEKYGHYLINTNTRIFVKYRTNEESPWIFNMQPNELLAIVEDVQLGAFVNLVLICGYSTVCLLSVEELDELVDLHSKRQQAIRVEVRRIRGSLWVQGSKGQLNRSIPHNSFPNKLFEE